MVVGYNFRFGRRAQGTPERLAALGAQAGFGVTCVPQVCLDGTPVSSTAIRQCLLEGDALGAAQRMGRAFEVSGNIQRGRQLGRTLGFPTVNLSLPPGKAQPRRGVYTSLLHDGQAWREGVTNVGLSPTVSEAGLLRIETFVMDGQPVPLYGAPVQVALLEPLREESKFPDVEALRQQVEIDKATAGVRHLAKKSLYFGLVP